jgi:hypothetical protein
MKFKSGAKWVRASSVVFNEIMAKGFKPKLQKMDNEASAALKNTLQKKRISSWSFRIFTEPMQHKELSELSKSISTLASPQSILISPHTCGTGSCPKHKSH